uniref:Uncharacterized protein n=1 Tax=Laticauda laticaudata TaxID=8630 RepID=A0A8C5RF40_LATLA
KDYRAGMGFNQMLLPLYKLSCFLSPQELETQYSPSRWSPRLDKDVVIEAHTKAVTEGMGYPRARKMG